MKLFDVALMGAMHHKNDNWVILDSDDTVIYDGDIKGVFDLDDEILAREEFTDGVIPEDNMVFVKLA